MGPTAAARRGTLTVPFSQYLSSPRASAETTTLHATQFPLNAAAQQHLIFVASIPPCVQP